MIVYFDASALVKRYVAELNSPEVERLVGQAAVTGTNLISRAEISAAIARAARVNWLSLADAHKAIEAFRSQWTELIATQVTQALVARADALAWEHGLRGYDAVHLASALLWQDALGEPVTLATYDGQLWDAAQKTGLAAWPETLE